MPTTFTLSIIYICTVDASVLFEIDYFAVCSCCLIFSLSWILIFLLLQPCSSLDPRCHLDMLCIFVTKIRWAKGVLCLVGGEGDGILKIRLNYTIFSVWMTDLTFWCKCLAHAQCLIIKMLKLQSTYMLYNAALMSCVRTMAFTCKLIKTVLGVRS